MISLLDIQQGEPAIVKCVSAEVVANFTVWSVGDESVHRDSTSGTVEHFGCDGIPVAVPLDRPPFIGVQICDGYFVDNGKVAAA
ncbi:hypothetical protein ES703_32507 [subsurface metagenome]